jgi:CelD/BcsL family acetyltransferase involved in cellulose biosynthesis
VATKARIEPEVAAEPLAGSITCVPWTTMDAPQHLAAWDRLADQAAEPNPFFESWYLLPSLRHLEAGADILRFDFGGELAGLLPIERPARYYRYPFPHLSAWQHPNMFCGAPLVARGAELAFWRAFLDWADRHAGAALFLHLRDLPLTGALHVALEQVLAEQRRQAEVVHREDRALLASDLSAETYWEASLSGKKRKELRRQANRLAEEGTVSLTRSTDTADVAAWCQDFLRLEQAGWKGEAGSALGCHPATAAVFCESLAGAASRGRLERLTLTLDGQPIAMLASFLTPPGAFSFKTAFDERFAKYSPGVLLQQANLAILDNSAIAWTDSCAAADHPMIDHIWRERRPIGRVSIAIGGAARRFAFRQLVRAEIRK